MYIGKNGKKYLCHAGYGKIKIGDRYGRVVVDRKGPIITYNSGDSASTWICKCDCGNEVTYRADYFKTGNPAYFRCEACKKNREIMYAKSQSIIERCNNPKSSEWVNYGGRGIRCELGVTAPEVADMIQSIPGYKKGYTIDRIDNNSNYTIYHPIHLYDVYDYTDPITGVTFKARGNLRWIDQRTNTLNRRVSLTISKLAETSRTPSLFREVCERYGWNKDDFIQIRDTDYPYEARYFYHLKEGLSDKYIKR